MNTTCHMSGLRMNRLGIFLSVVLVVHNQATELPERLREIADLLSPKVDDYEIIIVDNASQDDSISVLRHLSGENGLPNLQVFCLLNEVDEDIGFWVGIERSLGDFVITLDSLDQISILELMMEEICRQENHDIMFVYPSRFDIYRVVSEPFRMLYRALNRADSSFLSNNRIMNRKIINYILQHKYPIPIYRYVAVNPSFRRRIIRCNPNRVRTTSLRSKINRAFRYILSHERPLRLASVISFFSAIVNFLYTTYVFLVNLLLDKVEPGWTSLSLQFSVTFLLISIVLLLIGEYVLQSVKFSKDLLPYYVAEEFTSARSSRVSRLNVESFSEVT
jgi:glycosyltransferase involved in cell wall biosynthesis